MKKVLLFVLSLMLNACTTDYVLMDEEMNPVNEEEYTVVDKDENVVDGEYITANDVFVVGEGEDFVVYQYKNVRVDEISPLATMYCADIAYGGAPYLREVNIYHNGFMRATFDCVSLAI